MEGLRGSKEGICRDESRVEEKVESVEVVKGDEEKESGIIEKGIGSERKYACTVYNQEIGK